MLVYYRPLDVVKFLISDEEKSTLGLLLKCFDLFLQEYNLKPKRMQLCIWPLWDLARCDACITYPRTVDHYSRSYAEDVTSVTSGASQGPHSFNLVFVCLFVCVTPGAIPYLFRTCPVSVTTKALQDCT